MENKQEGDLYRSIIYDDLRFDIRYGYYDEMDRYGKYNDPIPIYPDFVKQAQYTSKGEPFVTQMQDPCEHYSSLKNGDNCYSCEYYKGVEDLLGICTCIQNRRKK